MGNDVGITEATLRELVSSGAVRRVVVVGQGPSWALKVEIGSSERTLRSAREPVRQFRSLDRLARWLRDLGIAQWTIDARLYDPDQRGL